MKTPSFRDLEQLSAFLDDKLSRQEQARLASRLESDADLRTTLEELRQTRALLRRIPKRRAPRNFTLRPETAGVRPPVPRSVPAFGWASAVAVVLFALTFLTNLVAPISYGPMEAAAPQAAAPLLGAGSRNTGTEAAPPSDQTLTATPLPAILLQAVPLATPEAETPTPTSLQPTPPVLAAPQVPAAHAPAFPLNYLQIGLVVAAALFGLLAFLIRLTSIRAFLRSSKGDQKEP